MIDALVSWWRRTWGTTVQAPTTAGERYIVTGQVGTVMEIPEAEKSATDRQLDRVQLGLACESCGKVSFVRTKREHASTPRDGFICADCRSGVLPPGTTPEAFFEQQRKSLGIDK